MAAADRAPLNGTSIEQNKTKGTGTRQVHSRDLSKYPGSAMRSLNPFRDGTWSSTTPPRMSDKPIFNPLLLAFSANSDILERA